MKHINRILLVAAAILAPLAAMADMADLDFRPPSGSEIWHDGFSIFATIGLPLLLGCGLLNWIYRRIRHRSPMPREMVIRRWIVWCLVLFSICMVLSALCPRV